MKKKINKQINELNTELSSLMEQLKAYSHQDLNTPPDESSWSVMQILQHLKQSEELSQKYLEKKLSFNPELKKPGAANFFRNMLLDAYLVSPIKYKAPANINAESLPAESSFWETVKEWNIQREGLESYLNSLSDDTLKREVYKHPFAGRLTIRQMLHFFKGHFKRHRRQIDRVLESYKY